MVQLIIDYSNNRILGFNSVIPSDTTDLILVEKDRIKNINIFDNYYYENGNIIQKDNIDEDNQELQETATLERNLVKSVQDEQKIFMDNVLNGKSVEEAALIARKNREELDSIRDKKKEVLKRKERKTKENILNKFSQEEDGIANKYFLSIITTVKDENDYIEEWLDYHIKEHNVEHFYIYDNESSVPLKDYLESVNYKNLDRITIIDWETTSHTQQDTCNHWLKNYGTETKWFICMDVDEFIRIKEGQTKTLNEFLTANANCSSIKCRWKHYTAGGQSEKSSEPVRTRFTVETDWNDWRKGGKYFAQTNRIHKFVSYVPQVRLNSLILDEDNEVITDFFQLNHYITKSYEEWVEKIKKGSVNPNYFRKYQEFFEINPDMEYLNTGEDYAQKYSSVKKEDTEN